jgi:ABC-type branched-subunit amino acid transport system ATPase component
MSAEDRSAFLDVSDISTMRGRVRVLWGVSLIVQRGETVALIGANGAGKSTLVGSITGLVPPFAGSVLIDGTETVGTPPEHAVRRRIALVPERRQVFGPLSVLENLHVGAYARRLTRTELAADVAEIFELFPGLVRYREKAAGSLSGGEQQMVAIGRALMARPELLVLDEPSLGLAPKVRAEIFGALARLAERGVALLLVEQNLRLAARICRRAYVMERGRIIGTADAEELARSARRTSLGEHTP